MKVNKKVLRTCKLIDKENTGFFEVVRILSLCLVCKENV